MCSLVVDVQHGTPERLGRYLLLDRIGEGGMAEVFRAVMPGAEGFARTFVVKRIRRELSRSARFISMFIEEARICARLSHPAIVQVYDFGAVQGNHFLAMEYLPGRDLASVMRKLRRLGRPCPPAVAAYLGHQLAEGLSHAHDLADADGSPLNIIHRDVSPANIMCLRTGGVKLLDFGVAKSLGMAAAAEGTPDGFRGKVAYTAPEQVRGEPIDRRVDLFSLGIVLWEMLAGRRLFKGATDNDTLANILSMPVPPPSSLQTGVPPALDAIVARALARDPALRYQSAEEMADDLEDVERALRYKSRLLPTLLRELFGDEDATSAPPVRSPSRLLTAAAGEGTLDGGAPRSPGLPGTFAFTPAPLRNLRRIGGLAAALLTVALLALLLARGRGGRAQALPTAVPVATPTAPIVVPVQPVQPPQPAPPSTAEAEAPKHRVRVRRQRSRITREPTRETTIDPFDSSVR